MDINAFKTNIFSNYKQKANAMGEVNVPLITNQVFEYSGFNNYLNHTNQIMPLLSGNEKEYMEKFAKGLVEIKNATAKLLEDEEKKLKDKADPKTLAQMLGTGGVSFVERQLGLLLKEFPYAPDIWESTKNSLNRTVFKYSQNRGYAGGLGSRRRRRPRRRSQYEMDVDEFTEGEEFYEPRSPPRRRRSRSRSRARSRSRGRSRSRRRSPSPEERRGRSRSRRRSRSRSRSRHHHMSAEGRRNLRQDARNRPRDSRGRFIKTR